MFTSAWVVRVKEELSERQKEPNLTVNYCNEDEFAKLRRLSVTVSIVCSDACQISTFELVVLNFFCFISVV